MAAGASEAETSDWIMAQPFQTKLPLVLSRTMQPEDANPGGNVHGGTILNMIAQSGYIQSTKHCNRSSDSDPENPLLGVIARVEHTDFLQPVFIGELCEVYAQVVYTSEHSIEVNAEVWSENLLTGAKRLTNRAIVWFVAMLADGSSPKCSKVPALQMSEEEKKLGEERYLFQKKHRHGKVGPIPPAHDGLLPDPHMAPAGSPLCSLTSLGHLVLPHDCHSQGLMQGGPLMKLMDSCAGIVASRHCKTSVVTASLEAIDFLGPIYKGELVTIKGRLVFASAKSMEIRITVEAENPKPGSLRVTNEAYFTFVSLDRATGKTLPVPPLVPQTDSERELFESRKLRYQERKAKRQEAAAVKQKL